MSQDELITKTRVIQARHTVTWDGLMHCHQPFPTSHHRQRTKWTLIIMSFAHPWTPSRYKQGWGWRTGWSDGWRTKRHISKRNIHNNFEMFSLHRLDDWLVGELDCGLVGALDDAQVVLAVYWTIEWTRDSLVDWVGDLLVHWSTHTLNQNNQPEEPVVEATKKEQRDM